MRGTETDTKTARTAIGVCGTEVRVILIIPESGRDQKTAVGVGSKATCRLRQACKNQGGQDYTSP